MFKRMSTPPLTENASSNDETGFSMDVPYRKTQDQFSENRLQHEKQHMLHRLKRYDVWDKIPCRSWDSVFRKKHAELCVDVVDVRADRREDDDAEHAEH